jgi:hypothetical protein
MGAYETAVPETELLATALPWVEWSDAYAVDCRPGMADDPRDWLATMLRRPPLWAVPVLGLRQVLALVCGIRPSRLPWRTAGRELLIAVDTGAFDCRVSLLREDGRVVLSTVGTAHDMRGRVFLALAGRVHPFVVRAALTKTAAVLGRARPCAVRSTGLLADALPRIDFADAYAVPVGDGTPDDPMTWAEAVFHDPPPWAAALLGLREALVGLVGIEGGRPGAFEAVGVDDHEVLVGSDAGHLDFRASVRREPDHAVVTTVVQIHNLRGRLYFAVVRLVHPVIVRAMLTRAATSLSRASDTPTRPSPGQTGVPAGCST